MSSTRRSPDTALAGRYGAPRPVLRMALVAVLVVVGASFVTWVLWAAWFHATPQVSSQLVGFRVVDDHETRANVDVHLFEDVEASCLVRALAEDHTPVGEASFVPVEGGNEVVIRTERRATSVEKLGCTTAEQTRPR